MIATGFAYFLCFILKNSLPILPATGEIDVAKLVTVRAREQSEGPSKHGHPISATTTNDSAFTAKCLIATDMAPRYKEAWTRNG